MFIDLLKLVSILFSWVLRRANTVKVILQLLQLSLVEKTSGAPLRIISGTSWHPRRATNVSLANWVASSHERIKSLVEFQARNSEGQMIQS